MSVIMAGFIGIVSAVIIRVLFGALRLIFPKSFFHIKTIEEIEADPYFNREYAKPKPKDSKIE